MALRIGVNVSMMKSVSGIRIVPKRVGIRVVVGEKVGKVGGMLIVGLAVTGVGGSVGDVAGGATGAPSFLQPHWSKTYGDRVAQKDGLRKPFSPADSS